MNSFQILQIYHSIKSLSEKNIDKTFSDLIQQTFLRSNHQSTRPNSISVEDAFFGDSGKGAVVAKLNNIFKKKGKVYSLRYNGGANAGHEAIINGVPIVTHQLPMGVIQKNTTAIISRGMVIHPEDLLTEIDLVSSCFNNHLPGKLLIDERVILVLDTHRAKEKIVNTHTTGGQGSTGRGIAESYMSVYGRYPVTLKDLLSSDWKKILLNHYHFYHMQIAGFGENMADIVIYSMDDPEKKRTVGKETEFIKRLSKCRVALKKYTNSKMYPLIENFWNDSKIPVTLEGAQGPGLDPYHGVYPDVTASRSMSRYINDATYNIIHPEKIGLRLAIMKTTYMSSVGKRVLPTIKDASWEKWIQETCHETGRSTGRLRDIYPVTIPIANYLKNAAGYGGLVATHLDASKIGENIRVITHYTDKKSSKECPYLPYQDQLDKLKAHFVEFESWDGEKVKGAKSWKELPIEAKKYLLFLSQVIAPVLMTTTGPDLEEYISFLPNL
ncbi:MAG: adenylosuccinate synthetase [Candidatus Daviesbacteria bacterium]|nr:adenylosuccinate synthetase [Candidatus Daviesbacteria bacterium]